MFDSAYNLVKADITLGRFNLHSCLNAYAYEVVSKEEVVNEGTPQEHIVKAQPWTVADLQRAVQAQWKEGVLSKNILYRVVEWKAGRQKRNFFKYNGSSAIKSCMGHFIRAVNLALVSGIDWESIGDAIHRLAGCPNAERARCQFQGKPPWKLAYVGVPTTTALLRFADPDIFGILDVNALVALRKVGIICSGFSPKATQYPPSKVPSYFRLLAYIGSASVPQMAPWQVDNALYVAGGGRQSKCPDMCLQRGASFCRQQKKP